MKSIRGITPGATQVAPRQTHEDARQARAGAFALYRLEYFRDNHFGVRRLAAAFPTAPSLPRQPTPGWNSLCSSPAATTNKSSRKKEPSPKSAADIPAQSPYTAAQQCNPPPRAALEP